VGRHVPTACSRSTPLASILFRDIFCNPFLICRSRFPNNIGSCLPFSLRPYHLLSLLTHHQQHQPELFLSALRDISCPPGSNIGALLGVALSSSCASLPLHHQQHQLELLLSALRDIRRSPGSNIGALLGVALSSSCASLPKYLEHRLDSYSSLGWNPLIENMFSTYSPLELNQHRMLFPIRLHYFSLERRSQPAYKNTYGYVAQGT